MDFFCTMSEIIYKRFPRVYTNTISEQMFFRTCRRRRACDSSGSGCGLLGSNGQQMTLSINCSWKDVRLKWFQTIKASSDFCTSLLLLQRPVCVLMWPWRSHGLEKAFPQMPHAQLWTWVLKRSKKLEGQFFLDVQQCLNLPYMHGISRHRDVNFSTMGTLLRLDVRQQSAWKQRLKYYSAFLMRNFATKYLACSFTKINEAFVKNSADCYEIYPETWANNLHKSSISVPVCGLFKIL